MFKKNFAPDSTLYHPFDDLDLIGLLEEGKWMTPEALASRIHIILREGDYPVQVQRSRIKRVIGIDSKALKRVLKNLAKKGFIKKKSLDKINSPDLIGPQDCVDKLRLALHELLKKRGEKEYVYSRIPR